MKTVLILLLCAPILAAQSSPPRVETVEGAGLRDDLFTTPTFRFQQIERAFPVGTYRGVSFRRDGLAFTDPSARGRDFRLLLRMGAADHARTAALSSADFASTFVRGTEAVVFNGTLRLPDLTRPAGLPAPNLRIPFTTPYLLRSPIGLRSQDMALDLDGTALTALGGYPLDADLVSVVAVKKPDPPCVPLNLGVPMTLDSNVTTGTAGYSWVVQTLAGNGDPVALMVGTTGDGVRPPLPPCKPVYSSGDVGIFAMGVGNARNVVSAAWRLPAVAAWSRTNIYLEALTPDASQPLGVAFSEGLAQPFPAAFGTVDTLTLFAPDNRTLRSSVEVHQAAVLIFD